MFESLMPKLSSIVPDGGAIYLRRIPEGTPAHPNGGIAYKIRTGIDFDAPDAVEPGEAAVSVVLDVLRAMHVPGLEQYGPLSVMRFAPAEGVALLIKRIPDGRFAIKVQSPCPFDDPDAVEPTNATVMDLVKWVRAVTVSGEPA